MITFTFTTRISTDGGSPTPQSRQVVAFGLRRPNDPRAIFAHHKHHTLTRKTHTMKKLITATTATALITFGAIAGTAIPAAATETGECATIDRAQLTWDWNRTVTINTLGYTLTKPAGSHDAITVTGSPAQIVIQSNGGEQDRTGQNILNGDNYSNIQWVKLCAPAPVVLPDPAPPVEPTPTPTETTPPVEETVPPVVEQKVTQWHTWETSLKPGGTVPKNAGDVTWPQTYVGAGQLTPECGIWYQQDLYTGNPYDIDAILEDGILTNAPIEDRHVVTDWAFVYGGDCAEPELPVDPETPVDPEIPEEPVIEEPVVEEPVEEPTETPAPVTPEETITPAAVTKAATADNTGELAQTGNNANIGALIGGAALALIAGAALIGRRKKGQNA